MVDISLPDGLVAIEESTFHNCQRLTHITIPDGVTRIGNYAFGLCLELTEVTLPESIANIGTGLFAGCYNLMSFSGKYASSDHRCLIKEGKIVAFASAGLTEYTIPDGVTTIGDNTFFQCRNLTSIVIPDGVYSIEFQAFYECSGLTEITIPESVTTIGEGAFSGCKGLTSITIPDGVTMIGDRAFASCENLTSFSGKFASSDQRCLVMDGKLSAFAPAGLTAYTTPDGVTTISKNAFSSCGNLTSLTLSDGVTTIEDGAFSDCSSLTSIYSKPTTPPTLGSAVFAYSLVSFIHVPQASVDAYKAASGWSDYASKIAGYDF